MSLQRLGSKSKDLLSWCQTERDPQIGSRVSPVDIGLPELSRELTQGPVGVIFVASCEGCSVASARRWCRALRTGDVPRLCVVSLAPPSPPVAQDIQLSCADAGVQAVFVWDQEGRAHHALNAFFLPRCYLFGADGILEWIQGIAEDIPAGMPLPNRRSR
jgi:hypothetical protein